MAVLGHSRRYCHVCLLVRYRQYPTLPTESWGADPGRLRRQDKSGRRPLALAGDASFCLHIGFGDGAWLARSGYVLARQRGRN